jgi:tRNA 2-thiouridine synthesizing protein A
MLEIDCRGLVCPAPIIELARHITLVAPGGLLAVVATDAAARHDVPAWCRMTGHEYVGEEVADDGAQRYVVRKSEEPPTRRARPSP